MALAFIAILWVSARMTVRFVQIYHLHRWKIIGQSFLWYWIEHNTQCICVLVYTPWWSGKQARRCIVCCVFAWKWLKTCIIKMGKSSQSGWMSTRLFGRSTMGACVWPRMFGSASLFGRWDLFCERASGEHESCVLLRVYAYNSWFVHRTRWGTCTKLVAKKRHLESFLTIKMGWTTDPDGVSSGCFGLTRFGAKFKMSRELEIGQQLVVSA